MDGPPSGYERVPERQDLLRRAAELSPKTIIIDIEPLVAYWDTSQQALDRGVALILDQAGGIPGLEAVCFATNSARRPATIPTVAGLRVIYVSTAHKPFRLAPYRELPTPGVVIGDQAATDGLLAHRLGYTFLHYTPPLTDAPFGPRLMSYGGRLVTPFLARRQ